MAGRPVGAFCPFLSGRDNLRASPGGAGSAITERAWSSDKPDWPNAPGTPGPGRPQLRHAATDGRARGGRDFSDERDTARMLYRRAGQCLKRQGKQRIARENRCGFTELLVAGGTAATQIVAEDHPAQHPDALP